MQRTAQRFGLHFHHQAKKKKAAAAAVGGGGGWVVRERIDNSSLPFFFFFFVRSMRSRTKKSSGRNSLSLSPVCVSVFGQLNLETMTMCIVVLRVCLTKKIT